MASDPEIARREALRSQIDKVSRLIDEIVSASEYKPDEEEAALLEESLVRLLAVRAGRDFAADEESVWNYRGSLGNWEIVLRPTPDIESHRTGKEG